MNHLQPSKVHVSQVEINFNGWRTSQPQASTPDISTPEFSTMNFWTMGLKSWWLKRLGLKKLALKSPGLKCHLSIRLKDISTLDFSTPDFSTPWFKNSWLKSPWLKTSWLKSLGLKGPGWKLGVEKSGVKMSFNHSRKMNYLILFWFWCESLKFGASKLLLKNRKFAKTSIVHWTGSTSNNNPAFFWSLENQGKVVGVNEISWMTDVLQYTVHTALCGGLNHKVIEVI